MSFKCGLHADSRTFRKKVFENEEKIMPLPPIQSLMHAIELNVP